MSEPGDDEATQAADPDGDDRRKHPRTPLSLLVQFRFNTFEDFLADYSHDISPGGMFIRTDEPQEEGSIIYLQGNGQATGSFIRVIPRWTDQARRLVREAKVGGSAP